MLFESDRYRIIGALGGDRTHNPWLRRPKYTNGCSPVLTRDSCIPTIDIINFNEKGNFPDHHHTHKDNMNVIDRTTLKQVGQTLLEVIYSEK